MKKLVLSFVVSFMLAVSAYSQDDSGTGSSLPWIIDMAELGRYVDITVGYAPKSPYNALKQTVSVNNLILKRVGFYTSIEEGLSTDAAVFHDYNNNRYFGHTLGVTTSLNQNIYFWGGIDLFTKSGVFYTSDKERGFRKEIGVAVTPYKWTVARFGWSESVGPTFTVGAKIPF